MRPRRLPAFREVLLLCAAAWLSAAMLYARQAPAAARGIPWAGPPGVTETVADIMERERRAPPIPPGLVRESKPWEFDMRKLARRPDPPAPTGPQWPPTEGFSSTSGPGVRQP